jgi:predicted RNA methylase
VQPGTVQIRKRELAIRLQQIEPHPEPKVWLEQYTIPADLAAEILFAACYTYGDIEQKNVGDLGCGTGRLGLGASMLGAKYVVGVDLDRRSVAIALQNTKAFRLQADWVLGDIETLRGNFDTVLMNPPFGTKQPHADIRFLETGMKLGSVVYSIHKSATRDFISGWLRRRNTLPEIVIATKLEIPHQFGFHRKKKANVDVDVIRSSLNR